MPLLPFSGRRLATDRAQSLPRLAASAAWLLGPRAWRLNHLATTGSPQRHAQLRRWGRDVSRSLDIRFDINGLNGVLPGRRYVVLSLHESFSDVLALLRLGLDLRFVARDELLDWPSLGRYLRASDQILVDTNGPRAAYRRMLAEGSRALDAGESLVVFPQGSILGVEIAFWKGAFQLAQRLDAWLLPVVVTGGHRVWEYPFSPVVRLGQPMSMHVMPAIPGHAVVPAELEREMKQLALGPDMAPARRFRPEVDGFWDAYPYEIDPRFPKLAAIVDDHRARHGTAGSALPAKPSART